MTRFERIKGLRLVEHTSWGLSALPLVVELLMTLRPPDACWEFGEWGLTLGFEIFSLAPFSSLIIFTLAEEMEDSTGSREVADDSPETSKVADDPVTSSPSPPDAAFGLRGFLGARCRFCEAVDSVLIWFWIWLACNNQIKILYWQTAQIRDN